MKVGIISINKYSKHLNFGAALHSYAFQQYLDKQGIDNVIIDYLPRFMKTYNMKYPFLSEQPKEKIKRFFLEKNETNAAVLSSYRQKETRRFFAREGGRA